MRPLLLHASSKAVVQSFRRVLHFLLGPAALPLEVECGGLILAIWGLGVWGLVAWPHPVFAIATSVTGL